MYCITKKGHGISGRGLVYHMCIHRKKKKSYINDYKLEFTVLPKKSQHRWGGHCISYL